MRVFGYGGGVVLGVLGLAFSCLAEEAVVLSVESGKITAPFVVSNGFLWQLQSKVHGNPGRAVYHFALTSGGSYVLRALVNTSGEGPHSFLVNIDAEPDRTAMVWDVPRASGLTNQIVSWSSEVVPNQVRLPRKVFHLPAGEHDLIICGNAGDAQLARFVLVGLPPAPTGLHLSGQTGH